MKLQLNIIKIIELADDIDSLTKIQKEQLNESLKQYFGQADSNAYELLNKKACIACCIQVVDTKSPNKVIYDFWEINFDSGTLFLPNSLEFAGIKKIQNSFCLADGINNQDLEELVDNLNVAKKVKVPEPIKILLNNDNEIVEFKNENDIPKKTISWIKFLKEHALSQKLVDKYRTQFDKTAWRLILNKSRLSEDFLESLASDIGWTLVSEYEYLSEDFIHRHDQYLDWKVMSAKQKLNEKQITEHQDKLDWNAISWAQKLPSIVMSKFKDRVNWESICMYQILDMDIIAKNTDKFNKTCWQNISQKQHLSNDLINNYPDNIDWGYASMNHHLTDAQLIEYSNKITWNRLINYGRTLGYQQILDLIAKDCIAYDDIEDIINERKRFELTDEQVKELKKIIKSLKSKSK